MFVDAIFSRGVIGRASGQAAQMTYYALFSLFPLILLVVSALSTLVEPLDPLWIQQQFRQFLNSFLPPDATQLILQNVDQALQERGSFNIIALASLVWSGIGLFAAIGSALDNAFGIKNPRTLWAQRFVGLAMTLTIGLLFVISILVTAVLRLLRALFPQVLDSLLLAQVETLFPFVIDLALFLMLYMFVPKTQVKWRAALFSAVLASAGFEIGKWGYAIYLETLANYSVVYGSLSAVIVLMFWFYILAMIALLGAELCALLNRWLAKRERILAWRRYSLRSGESSPVGPPYGASSGQ